MTISMQYHVLAEHIRRKDATPLLEDNCHVSGLAHEVAVAVTLERQPRTGPRITLAECTGTPNATPCASQLKLFCRAAPAIKKKTKIPMSPTTGGLE